MNTTGLCPVMYGMCASPVSLVCMRSLLLLLVLIPAVLPGQQATVRGIVRDSLSGQPLEGVVIFSRQSGAFTHTDRAGAYTLRVDDALPMELNAQLFGFRTSAVTVQPLRAGAIRTVDFLLVPLIFDQPTVVIRPGVPDTVWGDAVLAVADFVWTSRGLVMLACEKEKRWKRESEGKRTLYSGCRIIALDTTGAERFRLGLPEDAEKLYLSCFDDVFVIGRQGVHWLDERDGFQLVPMSREEFDEQVNPIVDTLAGRTYLSTWQPDYPAFEYTAWNPADSSLTRLRYIVNEEVMTLFRSSFKYLGPRDKLEAFKYELRTGIEKEIAAGYMSGFASSMYFEPMNAPLFILGDRLLLFDHHHDQLTSFDRRGQATDSTLIAYHRSHSGSWSGKLLQDRVTGEVYTTMRRAGYTTLHAIDASTGTTRSVRRLHWPYVSQVAVRNGWAYYLYRPFESSQRQFLYREKL